MTEPVHFTQYLRPDGRSRQTTIERSAQVAEKAKRIKAAGYRLECEVLGTGEVSFTVTDDEADHEIEVCSNGPDVPTAVDRLIEAAYKRIRSAEGEVR